MTETKLTKSRELWPDMVKVIACCLVVLCHFAQSMVKAGFMSDDAFYKWFQMTVYTFHVPLFFICSGFLYQKLSCVVSVGAWWLNVRKKAISLGIPYCVFTLLTLVMKSLAGDLANSAEIGPLQTLLFHPTAPYWFLYTLFFVFLFTPTAWSSLGMVTMLVFSFSLKLINAIGGGVAFDAVCS